MKKNLNVVLSRLFLKLSQEISKLTDADINNVYEGKADIFLHIERIKEIPKEKDLDDINFEKIYQKIAAMTSREDGFAYLKKHNYTKKNLELLAKYLDVNIKRADKSEQVIDKIIEATIGYRLRSEAIQKS